MSLLVSVIVITYNSEAYIHETLESIKDQTYKNIELIISDDFSSDNTLNICKNWIDNNSARFVEVHLISSKANTGIPSNCNRGIKIANGKWLKLIAGDDGLYNDCIENNVSYISLNPETQIVQSLSNFFKDVFSDSQIIAQMPSPKQYSLYEMSSNLQNQQLRKGNFIVAPSLMINRDLMQKIGLFDERYRLLEDYPMWLKITDNNIKIDLLKKVTVKYRIHSRSAMLDKKPYMSGEFAKDYLLFLKTYYRNKMDFKVRKEIIKYQIIIKFNKMGLNNNSLFSKLIFTFIFRTKTTIF